MKTFTRTPIAQAVRVLVHQLRVEHRLRLLAERTRLRAEMAAHGAQPTEAAA